MKNLIYVSFSFLMTINASQSQSCLQDGITFSTQESIDSFQFNYPNCTEIEGDVYISGEDISNLNGLNVLTKIHGQFFAIGGNPLLSNLIGLENLNYVAGRFIIANNPELINLTGLESLTTVQFGSLVIQDNPALKTLTGLESLTYALEFEIYNNDSLSSLTGLENLTSISAEIYIIGNSVLTNIEGMANIDAESIYSITISGNSSLAICDVKSVCDFIDNGDEPEISYNSVGCNNLQEVEEACEITGITSINSSKDFTIYPNPTEGFLTVSLENNKELKSVRVINQIGQIVLITEIENKIIDLTNLPKGLYFLDIEMENIRGFKKFIIR